MTEVVISKKSIFNGLLLLLLLAAAGISFPFLRRSLPFGEAARQPAAAQQAMPMFPFTPDADQPARQAAIAGAQAFYTVDYREQQGWLDGLCTVSTQIGCAVDQNALAPSLWEGFEEHKTVTTVQVRAEDKILEQTLPARGNALAQVWQIQIELSAPWPQQPQPLTSFEALALVIQEQDTWKFERFLTADEAELYAKGN